MSSGSSQISMHLEHWIDRLKIFYLLKCLFLHPCKYMYYIFLFRKLILFLFETWHQCNCRIGELFRISHSCQIYNCVRRYYNVFFVLYFVPFVNRQSKKWLLCSQCSNKNCVSSSRNDLQLDLPWTGVAWQISKLNKTIFNIFVFHKQ